MNFLSASEARKLAEDERNQLFCRLKDIILGIELRVNSGNFNAPFHEAYYPFDQEMIDALVKKGYIVSQVDENGFRIVSW